MAKRAPQISEDVVLRGIQYTKEHMEDVIGQAEEYVRENPGQAVLYAFVAGYILNRLPVGGMLRALGRLSFFAIRPAVLVYGATKVFQATQER